MAWNDSPDITIEDDVFSPGMRRKTLGLDVFTPNVQDAPPDEAGHYEPNRSRSNFHYAVPDNAPTLLKAGEAKPAVAANPYTARLDDIGNQLQSAYAAPHAGTARQIIGALFSRKNPQLGGIISGETQRQRTIEPLQQEYGLLSNIISANRAQQTADTTDLLHKAQTRYLNERPAIAEAGLDAATQQRKNQVESGLREKGLTGQWDKDGNLTGTRPLPASEMPTVKANPGLTYDSGIPVSYKDEKGQVWDVNDPNLPASGKALVATANKAHGQHVQESADAQARAAAAATQRQTQTFSRQDVKDHDKAYVQPAEGVEKSYEMMNNAYNEYKKAQAQGKELPTGAQSMLALSTHLSTTFGNVKGSRITKDMIQEHLHARSISDSAHVAIQRLTNGDVLSPDQWDAFHDLISNSRKLSWNAAVKQAKRKNIPVDFLPNDLQGLTGEEGGNVKGSAGGLTRNADGSVDWKKTLGLP